MFARLAASAAGSHEIDLASAMDMVALRSFGEAESAQMQVLDIIESAQSGEAMANLARQFGITEEQARAAAKAVLPELAHAIERNTLSRGGLADLVHALGQGHHEAILEAPQYWRDPRVAADGEAVATHILGSEARVDALSARAARFSGLGEGVIRMLLPILAQMLMGAISRYAKGGLGDILSKLPGSMSGSGGGRPRSREFETGGTMGEGRGFELPKVELPTGGYPLPPMPGSPGEVPAPVSRSPEARQPGGFDLPLPRDDRGPGGGFELPRADLPPAGGFPLPPMPPSSETDRQMPSGRPSDTRYGDPLPFPLPGPGGSRGGDNPYGDLSDILRRGSRLPDGAAPGGGGLWSIVRSVLGSALGFGNRGILGWLIRLVVMRWGWTILRRILTGR